MKTKHRWIAGLSLVTLAAGGAALFLMQKPAKAVTVFYNSTFKGVTRTLDGTKIPFIATGPATYDFETGIFTYDVTAPVIEAAIDGEGILAVGPKGNAFGQSSFDSGSWQGTAVILGKFVKEGSRFKGKIVVSIPNQLGPAPNGGTYTTGTISMEQQIPE